MRDHWWWRPGWRPGRSFYTWHLTFADRPQMDDLVSHYAQVVREFPTLDEVGFSGLHLTIQGVGFTDETSVRDVETIATRTQQLCSAIDPFWVAVGPAIVEPETVKLPMHPVEMLMQLRIALRQGIADVWGEDNIPEHGRLSPTCHTRLLECGCADQRDRTSRQRL